MAQRQCVHEGALDMCTLKIHSMWFPPSFVNELAWIYESRDVQGRVFAANCNNWIKDAGILMKNAQKQADDNKIQSRDILNIKARSSKATARNRSDRSSDYNSQNSGSGVNFWYTVKKCCRISKSRSTDVEDSILLHKGRLNLRDRYQLGSSWSWKPSEVLRNRGKAFRRQWLTSLHRIFYRSQGN